MIVLSGNFYNKFKNNILLINDVFKRNYDVFIFKIFFGMFLKIVFKSIR